MQKKLEADLISLAHSILQMKNKENVFLLKQKSKEIYEKLSILAFVEEYVNSTPNLKETKSELLDTVNKAFELKQAIKAEETISKKEIEAEEKVVFNLMDCSTLEAEEIEILSVEEKIQPKEEEVIEQPFAELEEIIFSKKDASNDVEIKLKEVTEPILLEENDINLSEINDVVHLEESKTMSLEEELQDTFSVDLMADLFENAQPKSLNDKLVGNIQIGLNDRIVFVKNLFNGSQEDYNRVVSQLNTFKLEKEAKDFINKIVKLDYNWSEQEDLEIRFMEIIERRFA